MSELWLPRSACGYDCLPAAGRPSISGAVLVVRRLAATVAVLLVAARSRCRCWRRPPGRGSWSFSGSSPGRCCGRSASGTRPGRLPERRALLVANHVSWLDTLVVLAVAPARLLAKHEVRDWPVIGRAARALGTVFVDRSRPMTLPATVARSPPILPPVGWSRSFRRVRPGAGEPAAVPPGDVPGGGRRRRAGGAGPADVRQRDEPTTSPRSSATTPCLVGTAGRRGPGPVGDGANVSDAAPGGGGRALEVAPYARKIGSGHGPRAGRRVSRCIAFV